MVAVQVRDVPDIVQQALVKEARRRGTSLQVYLLDVLAAEAAAAHNRALAAEWKAEPLLDPAAEVDVVASLRAGRDERSAAVQEATAAFGSP